MKKHSPFLLLFFFAAALLNAQNGAKKYLLIEHFTNSNCGTCANRNPGLFNLIGQVQYADDVHHISVHPKFPYPQCVFYQANIAENTAWVGLYPNVQGTPTLVLNGTVQGVSNPLLSESKLQTYLNQSSPVHLKVSETGVGNSRSAHVLLRALDAPPQGNYKIFAAVVERKVELQTPNGEPIHHNVFRKMLTAVEGNSFAMPAAGGSLSFDFQFDIPNTWKADEVYVLAFVKNADTKEVLNSGTRFDPALTAANEPQAMAVQVSPNPVSDRTWLALPEDTAQSVEVFAANGQRVSASFEAQDSVISIQTAMLAPGIYFVKVLGKKGAYVGKFLKAQ